MNKRVLLAEDEPNIVTSLTFLLERAGFEVEVQPDGALALARALDVHAPPLAVLVLDVMLPTLDGLEVLRRLRATPAGESLPVLMLTAKSQREDRDNAQRAGASAFMTKPFSNAEVTQTIARLAGA